MFDSTNRRVLCAALTLGLCGSAGCATAAPARRLADRNAAAAACVASLQASRFEEAGRQADEILKVDPGNPRARIVRALTRYKAAMHSFSGDARALVMGAAMARSLNVRYLRFTLETADAELAAVEEDLAMAAREPGTSLDLCLACWQVDWNRNGRLDDRDARLLQVEVDSNGRSIPEDSPRRRPTFRFDLGDVYWARALVSFQRAAGRLVLAYDLDGIDRVLLAAMRSGSPPPTFTIRLADADKVRQARDLILAGLAHSDRSRVLYLAEKDDEREWLPNPRQSDHPLPLPVDAALYETWRGVVGDLQRLVRGEEGLDITQLAQLGDHVWEDPPRGVLDVGKLLQEPGDVVLDFGHLDALDDREERADVERVLRDVFGDKVRSELPPTPLIRRLQRMKSEVERGEESFERKLRYLLWIN